MDKPNFDIISIGDSTIDTHIRIHDAEIECDKDKENCKICIRFGTKIPVDSLEHLVGGNAANNAIGAVRLGLKTAIYTNVGDDDAGHRILRKLKIEEVETKFVTIRHGSPSNYAAVLDFQGERTIFTYHQKWDYRLPELPTSKWVYLTSCGETFDKGEFIDQLVSYVTSTSARLAYNPGTYQLKADVKEHPELLKVCSVFIVNREEARKVLEIDDNEEVDIKKMLSQIKNLGPKSVVITDSGRGSFGSDGESYFFSAEFPAHKVQSTGAGDAYATALVAALKYGHPLPEAMAWGSINAASVVSKVGAQKGLLTEYEILKRRNDVKDYHTGEL